MRVERLQPSALGDRRFEIAIVIDVLRATSTAAVLFARGVKKMLLGASPRELELLPPLKDERYLVISELDTIDPRFERMDNSPFAAQHVELAGRVPVLVTTNGTRVVSAAAERSREVLLASFLNLDNIARYVRSRAPESVTILPSGDFAKNKPHIEDELCAAALESRFLETAFDTGSIQRCRAEVCTRRGVPEYGTSFSDDLQLSLSLNLHGGIPVARLSTETRGLIEVRSGVQS